MHFAEPESLFSRRTALRAGLTGAALVAAGAGAVTVAGPASALPRFGRFDLALPSYQLFRSKLLAETSKPMQSFAFDNVNQRLFIAQIQDGSSGDDLCVNQISFTGTRLGHMHLPGAGHGTSIGVQPVGGSSYIWMECDSDRTDIRGRGTALARFRFVRGGRPSVRKYLRGSRGITCATDPVGKTLTVRRYESGAFHYSTYVLTAAARGDFSHRLAHVREPATVHVEPGTGDALAFQGYTVHGQYLYCLAGNLQSDPRETNSYITCVDLHSGRAIQKMITRAGLSLPDREPEGMAIYRTGSGQTRLFFGLASHPAGSRNRYASLYYKNVLLR